MKHILLIGAAGLLLASCGTWNRNVRDKLYGRYQRDEQGVEQLAQQLFRDTAQGTTLAVADTTSFGNTPWQEVFTDAQLQALIRKALAQNTGLRKAALTVEQAEVGLRINRLAYLPSLAFSPQGNLSKAFIDGSEVVKTYSLPLQASWQIDAFGTLRNAKKQGELGVLQAKAGEQATRTAIVTGVANLYYSLQMLDEQLATTRATIKIWHRNIEVMKAMKEAGMGNSASIASAEAQVLQIEASVPKLEDNIRQLENSLCLLLHEAPHAIERSAFTAEGFPEHFSTGVPLALLANRPDLAIAEARLANAFYGVQGARGAFFPKITLSAQGAFTNSLGGMIMNPGKFLAAGVASLTQPLFAQGKLKGNLDIAKLQAETAQLDFEKALLTAGQEVSDALASYHTAKELTTIRQEQVAKLEKANRDTEVLFRNGNTTTYLETLTAQMNLLNGKLALINQRYEKVQAVIALYKALGGGRHQ